jgi:hypothetical protein
VHTGRFIFSQIVDFFPERDFRRIVAKYRGDYKTSALSSWDHLLALSFALLTFRESLRDLEDCLRPRQQQLYHLGFRGSIARSTLADANATRDCRIFEEFALLLIARARKLCVGVPVPNLVRVGECTAGYPTAKAHLIKQLGPRVQCRLQVAQAVAEGQLSERHREPLVATGERFYISVAVIPFDTTLKGLPVSERHDLRKNILIGHGKDKLRAIVAQKSDRKQNAAHHK